MNTREEVLAKVLKYKLENDLPAKLASVKSEWASTHTVGSIPIAADPIPTLEASFAEIILSGWEDLDEEELARIQRYPVAYVFVTEINTEEQEVFEQDSIAMEVYAAAIRIIDRGSERTILERKLYRYTHAVYWMMLADPYLSQSGWNVTNVSKAYSGTTPFEPLVKAGQVSFIVNMPEDVA